MTDKNPCPFCGDDTEYFRFLELCAEQANEKWRENEVKILTNIYMKMDFVQVVRCRDCKHYELYRTNHHGIMYRCIDEHGHSHKRDPDGFCAWGEHV